MQRQECCNIIGWSVGHNQPFVCRGCPYCPHNGIIFSFPKLWRKSTTGYFSCQSWPCMIALFFCFFFHVLYNLIETLRKYLQTFFYFRINYNSNSNLHYVYPPVNSAILTNIAHTLACVPRFYVQVWCWYQNFAHLVCITDNILNKRELVTEAVWFSDSGYLKANYRVLKKTWIQPWLLPL